LEEFPGQPVRAFVVWEPVLATDWAQPSTATLGRIPDPRAVQFWDKERLISHSMGEHDRRSVVWDYIAVYPAGAVWRERPPEALYHGGPVIRVREPARAALAKALQGVPQLH
jgi:hypothetical protein